MVWYMLEAMVGKCSTPPNEIRQTRSAKRGSPNEVARFFCTVVAADFFDFQAVGRCICRTLGGERGGALSSDVRCLV